MAGDDPGAATIAVILDVIQRAWNAVTGSVKAVMGGAIDILKTGMFIRWRRQMMQSNGSKLKHGYQSLKKLRRHEERGAVLKSVEIGTWDDAKLFKKELKHAGIDFALTHDKDGNYTLYYKEANEQDVLHAQYNILQQLYGDQSQDEQEQDSAANDSHENDRDQDPIPNDDREQDDQGREQQEREEQSRSEEEQAIPAPRDDRDEETERDDTASREGREQDDLEREEQARTNEEREEQIRSNEEQTSPARTEPTERTTSHEQQAPSVTEPVRAEASHPATNASRSAISHEPLSELKRQARERARAKNLARAQGKNLSHARHMNRVKAREFNPGH